jgi:RHS repeat-associated protein
MKALSIYDADGNRIAKGTITSWSCDTSSNGFTPTASYILDQNNQQLTEMDWNGSTVQSSHTNVWAAGTLIATYSDPDLSQSQTAVLDFQFGDWLGTRRVLTDFTGNPEETCHSLPYGDGEDCMPTPTEHLFTQHERDAETGNDYFKYRYYASSMGRWLSPDPSGLMYANPADPQSFNLYNYVGNNPLTRVDLLGLCWRGFSWACNLWNRTENLFEGDGFHTETYLALHPNQKKRHEGYLKETGALSSAPNNLIHNLVCKAFSPLLAAAGSANGTVGVGTGGNAGVGYLVSVAVDAGAQIVADKSGNVGVAFTVGGNPGYGVIGVGATYGAQVSASTVDSIYGLRGPTWDFGVSGSLPLTGGVAGPSVAADVAVSGPNATLTVTAGAGVWGRGAAFAGNYTFVPSALSTNCR